MSGYQDGVNPQKSWWGRHWKWVVPVGCIVPILGCGGLVVLLVAGVFGVLKTSDAYVQSLAAVRASTEVQTALGTPIESGTFVGGNISTTPSGGHADITYDVSGPRGSGSVHAIADKVNGEWTFRSLDVQPASGGERIVLIGNNNNNRLEVETNVQSQRIERGGASFVLPSGWAEHPDPNAVARFVSPAGADGPGSIVIVSLWQVRFPGDLQALMAGERDMTIQAGKQRVTTRSATVGALQGFQLEYEDEGRQVVVLTRQTLQAGRAHRLNCSIPSAIEDSERRTCDAILGSFRVGE